MFVFPPGQRNAGGYQGGPIVKGMRARLGDALELAVSSGADVAVLPAQYAPLEVRGRGRVVG